VEQSAVSDALDGVALESLPVFPLPRVVLFPGASLPLHLFEPRYCAMIEDCMAKGPRAMAIALLRPGWQATYDGRPPIYEIAGAGSILSHERLADGTHNIVLRGVARVTLEELPARGLAYRRAQATVLDDVVPPGGVPDAEVTALFSTAAAIAAEVRKAYPEFTLGIDAGDAPGRIADSVADRLIADPELRQYILETLDVSSRVSCVTQAVIELLALIHAQLQTRGRGAD